MRSHLVHASGSDERWEDVYAPGTLERFGG